MSFLSLIRLPVIGIYFHCNLRRFILPKNCSTMPKCFAMSTEMLHSLAISANGVDHEESGEARSTGISWVFRRWKVSRIAKCDGGGILSWRLHRLFATSNSSNHFGNCPLRFNFDISRTVISPRRRPSVSACSTMSRETDSVPTRSAMAHSGRVTAKPCRCSTSFSPRHARCSSSIFGAFALRRNAAGTVMCNLAGFTSESSWMLSAV
jgi:hypothetical protein